MTGAVYALVEELFAEGNRWRIPSSTLRNFSKRVKAAKREDDLSKIVIPLIERIKIKIRKSRFSEHQKEEYILSFERKKCKYLKWLRGR